MRSLSHVLCCLLLAVLFSTACRRADLSAGPEEEKPDPLAWVASLDPRTLSDDEKDILAWLATRNRLIDLYRLQENLKEQAIDSPVVNRAIEDLWEHLSRENPPMPMMPELDLVDLKWEKISPATADAWAEYEVTWLFYVKEPIAIENGLEERLILRGNLRPIDLPILHRRRPNWDRVEHTLLLRPRITAWPAGEYRMISRQIAAPDVPVQLTTFLTLVRLRDGTFRYVRRLSVPASLEFQFF